jgi:DNA/RNA-binding domain of Phe-tRNA-synthetase-like protein
MTGLERLTKEVAETKDAVKTAVALIVKMVPAIPEEALNALADSLDADQKALLDAVQASGTVEPPATPEV